MKVFNSGILAVVPDSTPAATSPDLLMVCIIAFVAVMCILSILSILIQLITRIFPALETDPGPAMTQAIHQAVSQTIPGARIVQIKPIPKK